MQLVIGNKRYSSWSLRPWLLMRHAQIPFEEISIPLDLDTTAATIARYSPAGKVPVLIDGPVRVWESLAIAEYLHEKFPEKSLWPRAPQARTQARALASEMHAGFLALRTHLPHDLQKELTNFHCPEAEGDIARIKAIWREALDASGGPFLFGGFGIVDAMFAPVANRFVSYAVPVEGPEAAYLNALRELPAHREWIAAGRAERLQAPRH